MTSPNEDRRGRGGRSGRRGDAADRWHARYDMLPSGRTSRPGPGRRHSGSNETFVHSQIQRALGWSRTRASLNHWRDPRGREVDLVIEAPDGRIVGIEVKAAASVTTDDTVGLRALAEVAGPRFVHGFVLHLGERCTRFGSDITAAPASHLWLG